MRYTQTEQYHTEKYLKSLKKGQISVKPNHLKTSETTIKSWMNGSNSTPQELLDHDRTTRHWKKFLDDSKPNNPTNDSIAMFIATTGLLSITGIAFPQFLVQVQFFIVNLIHYVGIGFTAIGAVGALYSLIATIFDH